MLQDPCEVCRSASTCRLKLNCSRYLRHQEALQRQEEDAREFRKCQLAKTCDPALPLTVKASWKLAAQAYPWRPAAEIPKTTTLPEPAQEEETIMNENLTNNPAVEAAKRAAQRIVSLQRFRSEKDSPAVRGLFIDLSVSLLRDELMAAEYDSEREEENTDDE